MNAVIISIGNELLSGHENSNASWICQKLNENGISVQKIFTISDDKKEINKTLDFCLSEAQIVISTGGLGPTKDDITKNTLCKYFNCGIYFSESSYKNIERIFKTRGLIVSNINKKQAEVPEAATAIPNLCGTAPGLWFDVEDKTYIALPGVPFEMKSMFEDFVIPKINSKYNLPVIVSRTILTQGIGESFLSELIAEWEESIPHYVKLAYLPSPGIVRLKLTAIDNNKELLDTTLDNLIAQLQQIIPEYIYGYDNQKLEDIVGALLVEKNQTVSTAESCTGGYLSHLLTSCPGSSEYYKGSVIAYANELKINVLNIPDVLINNHGAVSQEVALAMAKGVRSLSNTSYGIAITGIAGPSGATENKPVGTVWIAVADEKNAFAELFLFGDNRMLNIKKSAITALNLLRKVLQKI